MTYNILFFSGTGGTKLTAEKLKSNLESSGNSCTLHDVGAHAINASEICRSELSGDMLIIMFPVHAFGAPRPMYEAIDKLPKGAGKPAAVISVSAGGDVPANDGCNIKVKRKLRSKDYNVIFEDMIMMPSNWAYSDPKPIANLVVNVLDDKVRIISNALVSYSNDKSNTNNKSIVLKTSYGLRSRVMAAIGTFSRKIGFPIMGKFYKADSSCNGCAICASKCPVANIKMVNGKPRFGWKCLLCMRCIYGCPENAINAGPFNFIIVKEGYDINELTESAKKSLEDKELVPNDMLSKHTAVKNYIEDISNNKV